MIRMIGGSYVLSSGQLSHRHLRARSGTTRWEGIGTGKPGIEAMLSELDLPDVSRLPSCFLILLLTFEHRENLTGAGTGVKSLQSFPSLGLVLGV